MYCLYESINEHNADIDFFVHALAMFWDQNQKNRWKIDDVIILQNLDTKLRKMSITSKTPEISKIPYKQKCLRIRYCTQYWNFRSIEWLVNMWTHKVHAPLKCIIGLIYVIGYVQTNSSRAGLSRAKLRWVFVSVFLLVFEHLSTALPCSTLLVWPHW